MIERMYKLTDERYGTDTAPTTLANLQKQCAGTWPEGCSEFESESDRLDFVTLEESDDDEITNGNGDVVARYDHEATLRNAAEQVAGRPMSDPDASAALDTLDWSQFYPVIDADGKFTGEICGSDEDGFWNVDDLAMISHEDAKRGGWTISDGYASHE